MRFTISDETGYTLLELLTGSCFIAPPGFGYLAGKEAGIVGIMIGVGVGLGAGVLAAYAMNRTVLYWWFKLDPRLESQPWVFRLIDLGYVWTLFLTLAAAGWGTFFLTRFIVQQMAG